MTFTPRQFSLPALMTWTATTTGAVENNISDHNRDPLSIDVTRIEDTQRMANGTMRKYIIADKRTFSTGWTDLPHNKDFTVDGFWGKTEIENWYNTQTGPFILKLHMGDGTIMTYTVMMTKYNAEVSKRGVYDFWKVSVEMQEV